MHNMNNVSTNLLIDCQLDNEVENNFINDEDEAVVVAECVICLDPIIPFSGYRFDCSHQLHCKCFLFLWYSLTKCLQ